jgi:hypothetical protein
MKNSTDTNELLDQVDYVENHIMTFPRLALIQKTLEFPDHVTAKFSEFPFDWNL